MTPFEGVVVGHGRVELESGRVVSVPHIKGVRRWDTVHVYWDYVRGRPLRMARINPRAELDETPAPPQEHGLSGEEAPETDDSDLDSGALSPVGVEAGDSGFWCLELSSGRLAAAGVE